ncbi:MAG: hypothetical protein ACK48X_07340 [Planctomycetota bacterium]
MLATKLDCDILWFDETQRSALAIADKPNIQRGLHGVMLGMPSEALDFPSPRLGKNWMIRIAHLSLLTRIAIQFMVLNIGIFKPTNATVHRAAANDIDFRNRAARGSVCNGLLLPVFL